MTVKTNHSRSELRSFLERSPGIYLYLLGDLDDRFWDHCSWYSLTDDSGEMKAVVLLFRLFDPPTLIAMADDNDADVIRLINAISACLPVKVYAHFTPGLRAGLKNIKLEQHFGIHNRMMLESLPVYHRDDNMRLMTMEDIPLIRELYSLSYPENWFHVSTLDNGRYLGCFDGGKLVAVGGTHIFSPDYGVSALGNITTHPAYRGRGIGTRLTSRLCHLLRPHTPHIGLNVTADNASGIRTYEKAGFRICSIYEECIIGVIPLGDTSDG